MTRPLLARIGRGLAWAIFGRPARRGIGRLGRPRVLYVEATVSSADAYRGAYDEPVAWARLDLGQDDYRSGGRVGFELSQMMRGSERREAPYELLRTIVRGGDLTVETAHGESLTLREGSFTCVPRQLRATKLRNVPAELDGAWPGRDPDRPLVKQACLRRGDVVRFEALFTPERHPKQGDSYRDGVEVRTRVDRQAAPIEILLVVPDG